MAAVLSELLQDRAALYVSGAMSPEEREGFGVLVEFDRELREHVAVLQEAAALTLLPEAASPARATPPAELKLRILVAADAVAQEKEPESLVVTDPLGRIVWVNAAFTALCGYAFEELQGRKPGELLQGPETDPETVQRIRAAVRARRSCREQLVNYHKDGSRYRAEVRISPFLDDEARPVWFVARERRLAF